MHTGRHLNCNLCHPACHKQSVVSSLVMRPTRICSSDDEMRKELRTTHQELLTNRYPETFVKDVEDLVLHPRASHFEDHTFLGSAKLEAAPLQGIVHMPSSKLRNQLVRGKGRLDSKILSARYHAQTVAAVPSAKLATSSGGTPQGRGQQQESIERPGRARR